MNNSKTNVKEQYLRARDSLHQLERSEPADWDQSPAALRHRSAITAERRVVRLLDELIWGTKDGG